MEEINIRKMTEDAVFEYFNKGTIFESIVRSYKTFDEYQEKNDEDMWDYERIPTTSTGLAVDVFADDAESYKIKKHPLWIYFRNSYNSDTHEYLPVLIDKDPRIPFMNAKVNISKQDLDDIKQWVSKNYKPLRKIADGDGAVLTHLYHSQGPLEEMANLKRQQTGMKITLWVDNDQSYLRGGHAKRLKFDPNNGNRDSNIFPSIRLHDLTLDDPYHQKPDNALINYAREFVSLNRDLLDKVSDRIIHYNQFLEQIKLIKDSNVNVFINFLESHNLINRNYMQKSYKTLTNKSSFDWTMVELDGQYNFINMEKKLYSQQWFDEADIFRKYNNGYVAAKVKKNGKEFYIYLNKK